MDWIHVAQDRKEWVFCEPSRSIKFGGFRDPLCIISFLRRTLGNGDR